jgi:hypothetical protein
VKWQSGDGGPRVVGYDQCSLHVCMEILHLIPLVYTTNHVLTKKKELYIKNPCEALSLARLDVLETKNTVK